MSTNKKTPNASFIRLIEIIAVLTTASIRMLIDVHIRMPPESSNNCSTVNINMSVYAIYIHYVHLCERII